jgi:hypothetical protein
MIKEIPKSDVMVRSFKTYKEWTLDENDIKPVFGIDGSNTLIDVNADEKTYDIDGHGFVKKIIYASIKSQFYTNPATASLLHSVGRRKSYASTDERVLGNEIAVFSIPQQYYGEGIKVGSVVLNDKTLGRTYIDDGYSNLIDSGSNIKGNIFYDRGLVVVTTDVISGSVLNTFSMDFRSTKTIFENEVFISVLEHEFNYSQNPSAVYEDGGKTITHMINRPGSSLYYDDPIETQFYDAGLKVIRGKNHPYISTLDPTKFGSFDDYEYSSSLDPTGSYLTPMITTIALYDDDLNMVAVAKLPQPIKSLPDYPVNFIIRFDT